MNRQLTTALLLSTLALAGPRNPCSGKLGMVAAGALADLLRWAATRSRTSS